MVSISFTNKEVNCKLIYCGPGSSGKTATLEAIEAKAPPGRFSPLTSISWEKDPSVQFEYLNLQFGKLDGLRTRFHLYSMPAGFSAGTAGPDILQGVDGIVFVADSGPDRLDANREAMANLIGQLRGQGIEPDQLPILYQLNKQDVPGALPSYILRSALEIDSHCFESVATDGKGVLPALKQASLEVMERVSKEYGFAQDETRKIKRSLLASETRKVERSKVVPPQVDIAPTPGTRQYEIVGVKAPRRGLGRLLGSLRQAR